MPVVDPRHGPVLRVTVENPPPMQAALAAAGIDVPDSISGWAVVDTGADQTCVAEFVAEVLQLRPIDTKDVYAPMSPAPWTAQVYWSVLTLHDTGSGPRGIGVLGASLSEEPIRGDRIIALVGRDLLSQARLVWNGPDGTFDLRFRRPE